MEPLLSAPQPIGIGTAECESLSSYVQRLAAAHGTLPGQLVFRLLTWMDLGQPEMAGQWQRQPRRVRIGKNNNSFTHADVWLRLLQRLTSRSDLQYMTTRGWDHLFPALGFQREHLAWCPWCLTSDLIPYHRLAWLIRPVHVCVRHATPLQTKCRRCCKTIPVIHERSAVTMCPRCGEDLRLSTDGIASPEISEFDLWTASEVGRLVQQSADWHISARWNAAPALAALCRAKGLHDAAAFARFIGTSKITTWYWLNEKARPSLPMALHVYHHFGASLAAEIGGGKKGLVSVGVLQPEMHLRKARKQRTLDWNKIERALSAELKSKKTKPLAEIARTLQTSPRCLRRHFAKLCLLLTKRHKKRLHDEAAHRLDHLREEIRSAALELGRRGEVIDQRRVALFLGRPGLFCRHFARKAFHRVCSELGVR